MNGYPSIKHSFLFSCLLLAARNHTSWAQLVSLTCSASNCGDCINQGCGWAPAAESCLQSCSFIADTPCYSPSTTADVCAQVEIDQSNKEKCSQQTSCGSCTATLQVDETTPCQWHYNPDTPESKGYCGTGGCNLLGFCGSSTCPVVVSEINGLCTQQTDCTDCLTDGCAWAIGSCLETCDIIADVSCSQNVENPAATCTRIAQEEQDAALCSAQTECGTCTMTSISNGAASCNWFAQVGGSYCGSSQGCDSNGVCGSSECPQQQTSCRDIVSCEGCLDSDCSWAVGSCMDSCSMIADVSCYEDVDSSVDTCDAIEQDNKEYALCSAQSDCGSCVSTMLSDDNTCKWFQGIDGPENSYCGNTQGCHFNGACGLSECPKDAPCNEISSCTDCLDDGCAWAVGTCLKSCSEIADVSCYDSAANASATCEAIEQDSQESALCSAQQDCGSCVSTSLVDDKACNWFPGVNGPETSYCGNSQGCDFNGVCGSTECTSPAQDSIGMTNSSKDCEPLSFSCGDCLSAGCVWAADGCWDRCDAVLDTACYEVKDSSPSMICDGIQQSKKDYDTCAAAFDCDSCLATQVANTTCNWFSAEGTSYCSNEIGCDFSGTCPALDCDTTSSAYEVHSGTWFLAMIIVTELIRLTCSIS